MWKALTDFWGRRNSRMKTVYAIRVSNPDGTIRLLRLPIDGDQPKTIEIAIRNLVDANKTLKYRYELVVVPNYPITHFDADFDLKERAPQ